MGIENDLNAIRRYRKTIFHLAMITSVVATATTLITTTSATSASSASAQHPAIPYCDDKHERTVGRRLLYITTLDGRLSALDISKSGQLRWSIPTGPGPLISSSIHRLELTNNGQFVRMIPSLSGGIYKFDGESIDPIPITTENLLSSSAKFSDDLVISGGKETRTYGVSARTGQLLYECSMHGCVNATDSDKNTTETTASSEETHDEAHENGYLVEHDPLVDDVVVVRRLTQTVRAVESRTGIERWNFSVGQHEVDLLRSAECHENRKFSDMDMAILDVDIRVIVPEGVVCAVSKTDPHIMLWKYKFDHPIVSAWKIGAADELESIDMFSSAQWLWDHDENIFDAPFPTISPSIYLGMYDKQLYIQESVNMRKEINDHSSNLYTQLTSDGSESMLPKIPWRPIAASSNSLIVFQDDKILSASGTLSPKLNEIHGNELVPYDDDRFALTAQSVLNASEYVNGNGFFFFAANNLNGKQDNDAFCDKATTKIPAIEAADPTTTIGTVNESDEDNHTINDDLGFSLDDIDAPVKVVILSLWFWWKEIVVIAFTSAVMLNLFLGQRQRGEREIVVIERHIPVPTAMEATEASTVALLGPVNNSSSNKNHHYLNGYALTQRSISESTNNSGDQFTSRFQTDFDLLQCLGRGGFGVVFEAQNKLDENKYAVKRITLPNKEASRQRVLREARTLASCEHQNIVRYFHSWVEMPPTGWQEEEDRKLLAHEMSTSIQIETPDGSTLPSLANSLATFKDDQLQRYQLDKKNQLLSWVSSAASTACSFEHEPGDNCLNGIRELDEEFDDDSLIIFRSESQSAAMHDNDENTDDVDVPQHKVAKDAIAIDIHSNSFDMSLRKNGKNIDYSQLSDSFQIEFVRSANIDDDDEAFDNVKTDSNIFASSYKEASFKSRSNHKRSQMSLALPNSHTSNNNNGTPTAVTLSSTAATNAKPNKVYLYIQMQLCRKESLRDWLRDNRTEARELHIASIFHQIVDAVDYVHLKGLIHRDLKPSNIFFSQDGQIKIGDFGLVTDMSDIPNLITKCGDNSGLPSCARHTQQVGTHLYMSPEQLRGKHYDYKVDIYSLGLIFFELHVYFATEMERIKTLRDLREGKYPSEFPHSYPAEYVLLQKMLAKDPAERPQTKELKMQMHQILKLPDHLEDGRSEAAAMAAAARRLSRSRTFSSSE